MADTGGYKFRKVFDLTGGRNSSVSYSHQYDQLQATQQFYNRWARLYDQLATAPGVSSWRQRAAETLSLAAGDTVVEMGCGTGANFPALREAVGPTGTVVGIDLVGGMLDQARYRIDREGWANVHAIRGDATQPPVDEADAVISTFLIGMLADPAAAVRTWIELVGAGGRVTIMNAGRSDQRLATPLNLAFRGFVRLAAPGEKTAPGSPVRELEARWEAARTALFAETVDHVDRQLGGGFILLASGRVPE
jgi:ubiquinone/menaquinone biosynthesis C-methylase UbiE